MNIATNGQKDKVPSFEVNNSNWYIKPALLSQMNSWLFNAVYISQVHWLTLNKFFIFGGLFDLTKHPN